MESVKSFYNLDYIIELGEKRVEQYADGYQKVMSKIANIIFIYSGVGIYLVPVIHDIPGINSQVFAISLIIFVVLFGISIYNAVRMMIPENISYLDLTSEYYHNLLTYYENREIRKTMSEVQVIQAKEKVHMLLKLSYLAELAIAQRNNRALLYKKAFCYNRALFWALWAILPYAICIGYHITKVDQNASKASIAAIAYCAAISSSIK